MSDRSDMSDMSDMSDWSDMSDMSDWSDMPPSLSSAKKEDLVSPRNPPAVSWVKDGARTHDLRNHNPTL